MSETGQTSATTVPSTFDLGMDRQESLSQFTILQEAALLGPKERNSLLSIAECRKYLVGIELTDAEVATIRDSLYIIVKTTVENER